LKYWTRHYQLDVLDVENAFDCCSVPRRGKLARCAFWYFPRDRATHAPSAHNLAFETPAGDALLITNLFAGYEHLEISKMTANDTDVSPAAHNDLSWLYAAPESRSQDVVKWHATVITSNLNAVDIVAMADVVSLENPDFRSQSTRQLDGCEKHE
jgi:hypothetical protein